ncbi:outer membrane lipoprotein-sorting protein [Prosthecobacter fusiformis]|uniref:Outer membrane lipoprotein-sorting protein n=1 Tax=Prosthecobacter fusiformis TaxID=48464 RepID=A0A4R7SR09_9BACT|nr:outer membrane lipoprotein-sorting protein [Prosthecobacter fusiformis]TDU81702.1 outer membrane lipoprotein-sorting protein [Prosthecobacter fusiformis]
MKRHPAFFTLLSVLGLVILTNFTSSLHAADEPATAADLASRMNAIRSDGTSFARLRMEINGGGAIQIQTKERHTQSGSDAVYQILFPKERKGESVLLRKSASGATSGSLFVPPETLTQLSAAQMKNGLFGSDLAYEDVIENFFAWSTQSLVGTAEIDRTACQILESKPGNSDRSSYASVRTWIDPRRMVPLRVEKYNASGTLLLRIETKDVAKDDRGHYLPASLTITRAGSGGTMIQGSRIRHGVPLTDADFSPAGIQTLTTPK